MSNDDLDDLGDLFKSMQVGRNVVSHGFFGSTNRAARQEAAVAAAVSAGEAALAAGSDPVAAAAAAGAAGEALFEPAPRYAQKSKKRATPRRATARRTTQRETAQNLKVKKELKELERLMAAHARERRLRARSGVPYKGRLSKKTGRQSLHDRLYSLAMASLKPKSITRRRPVKNTVMK